MKKFLAIIFSCLLCFSLPAQNYMERTAHMTFKNIPLKGKTSAFAMFLSREGFRQISKDKTTIALQGTFAGIDECTVYVVGTDISKTTWKVAVSLPAQRSWDTLLEQYKKFTSEFTDKYGKPKDQYEFIKDSTKGRELAAISKEEGEYFSYWELPTGSIVVKIVASDSREGHIGISYDDKKGAELQTAEEKQIVQKDI